MRITVSQLRRIIKEEVEKANLDQKIKEIEAKMGPKYDDGDAIEELVKELGMSEEEAEKALIDAGIIDGPGMDLYV